MKRAEHKAPPCVKSRRPGWAGGSVSRGRFEVLRRGLAGVYRTGAAPEGSLLGARFHADIRPLLRALAAVRRLPARSTFRRVTGARCGEGSSCQAPLTCQLGTCLPRCQSQADCQAAGLCEAVCQRGACIREDCGSGGPCAADTWCEAGRCVVPEPELASEDEGYSDTRWGRGWGERCFRHLRAGRLAAAEAACERGRVIAGPRVRGAILYNLGRIAEQRGRRAEAVRYYERSLAARPINRTVQQRLRALRAHGGQSDAGTHQ